MSAHKDEIATGSPKEGPPQKCLACGMMLPCGYLRRESPLEADGHANQAGVILTVRERECMLWSAQGLTEKKTAEHMKVAPNTAHVHIENAKRKLGVRSKLSAIVQLIKSGEIQIAEIETEQDN